MKRILTLSVLTIFTTMNIMAQSLAELQAMKAEKAAVLAEKQAEVDALAGEISGLSDQIVKLSGWNKGYSGLVGFNWNKSNNWINSPNPNASASALNITLNGFANKITDDYFWRNKGVFTKAWSDVDLSQPDMAAEDDGLFDNGTVDILNISSLYGRPLNKNLALSGLGELNTSLSGFLDPGTLDLGLGLTWTPPVNDLVVVMHPLNYRFAFSGIDGLESTGSVGAKVRADFNRKFGKVAYTSMLTTFIPYTSKEPALFEYTWINSLSFDVWKGIGVGISFGLRNAEFEYVDGVQSYYSLGLSYSL